jgi:hypothetical protein
MITDRCAESLNRALQTAAPRTLLAVGPVAAESLASYAAAHRDCVVTRLSLVDGQAQTARLDRFEFAFVGGVVEHLPKPQAIQLLGRLRDFHAPLLYVLAPMGPAWQGHVSAWEQNDFIALGMERVVACGEGSRPLHLYRFDLRSYKATPEWFNSRYWAHPELWDK